MPRYVTVITVREVYRCKMAYHGDMFLHIVAVTIVNNADHTLHYAVEEELQSRTFLLRSAVVIISKDLFVYKRKNMCFILYDVYVSSVADLDRPKKYVLRLGQNATDRNRP